MNSSNVKVGDRIVVVRPEDSGGFYDKGDTARVLEVYPRGEVEVNWETNRFSDPIKELKRPKYLYAQEFELDSRPEIGDIVRRERCANHGLCPVGTIARVVGYDGADCVFVDFFRQDVTDRYYRRRGDVQGEVWSIDCLSVIYHEEQSHGATGSQN